MVLTFGTGKDKSKEYQIIREEKNSNGNSKCNTYQDLGCQVPVHFINEVRESLLRSFYIPDATRHTMQLIIK